MNLDTENPAGDEGSSRAFLATRAAPAQSSAARCAWALLPLAFAAVVQAQPSAIAGATPGDIAAAQKPTPQNGYAEVLKSTRSSAGGKAVQVLQPYAPIKRMDDEGQVPEIEMFVGESRVFPAPGVARIAVGNGALLTAAALDNKEVILFANGAGTSSLFVWNADGRYQRVKVNIVPGDTTRYAREIAAFLSTIPKAKASVVGANIIVEGDELSDADVAKIEELAKRYPQIVNFTNRVGWEQMVMMDVKVVEFPRTLLTDIGLKWNSTGGGAVGAIWGPGRRGHDGPYQIDIQTGQENPVPITTPNGGPVLIPRGLNVLSVVNMGLNAQLNLLAQEGKAAVLAEPQLSARSGAKAEFLAGGQIPYAVVTNNGVHVEFKSYGVKLEITPRVDHKGVIRASIKSEVSSVDRSITTPAGPALLSRETTTEFNLRDGETMVLSGLLQRDVSTDIDKVPLLGDIPVLGAMFRSKRYQNKETELVVFVTPRLVNAQSPGIVDRIERATQRLEERMGPSPYLSEPLQPGVRYEKPDNVPAPAAPAATGSAPAATAAAALTVTPIPITPLPPAPTPLPVSSAAMSVSGNPLAPSSVPHEGSPLRVVVDVTALRAQPHAQSPLLMQLGNGAIATLGTGGLRETGGMQWRQVAVGELQGWVPADAVQPLRGVRGEEAPPGEVAKQDRGGRAALAAVGSAPGVRATVTAPAASGGGAEAFQRYRVTLDKLPVRVAPDVNAGVVTDLHSGDLVEALPGFARGAWMPVNVGRGNGRRSGWVAAQWLEPAGVN